MEEQAHGPNESTGIQIGANGRVGDITVHGDVAGRDIVKITEELAYDVSDLSTNPYLGLANYTYATRALYGGREPQIHSGVQRLTQPGDEPVLVFVTGASGSGKTSFAQAGLLPALEEAYRKLGCRVRWSVARPGRHPVVALGRALEDLGFAEPSGADWTSLLCTAEDLNLLLQTQTPQKQVNVLILDQFEELFTHSELGERDTACALLAGLAPFARVHTHAIATLRADYLPALFDVPSLFECCKQNGIELRAMTAEELARAIRRPIQEQARLENKDKRVDPALLDRLIEDLDGDPALLPLAQVTLRALWDEPPHRMVVERYRSLTHSLEQQADQLVDHDCQGRARRAAEQQQLMGIFLDLVEVSLDEDPHRDVRHTLPKRELLEGHPERTKLIEELVNARLLTASIEHGRTTTVEVIDIIHETLLSSWPRLRQEIADRREALQQRERFRLGLREWLQSGRSRDYLLQGVRLAEARSLDDQNDVALRDPDGRDFLQVSNDAETEVRTLELRRARRRQRVLGGVAGVAAVFAAAALVAAIVAVSSQQQVVEQRDAADSARSIAISQANTAVSRQLAAEAATHLGDQLDLAMLLSVQSYRTQATVEARGALLSALEFNPALVTSLRGHTKEVTSVAYSPDGTRLASASYDGTVRLWDVASREPLGPPLTGHTNEVTSVAFSTDGTTLASAGEDGTVRLWDVASGQSLGPPLTREANQVTSVAFSANGRILASASTDSTVRLWDVASRQPLGSPLIGHTGVVNSVSFSPDGRTLASASDDGTVRLWDVANRQSDGPLLTGHIGGVYGVAFSPDGTSLASAGEDGTVRLWDVAGAELPGSPLTGHAGAVFSVAFSPDGRTLASAGQDDTLRLWDVTRHQSVVLPLSFHSSATRIAFSPDGTTLASAGSNAVRLWDVSDRQSLGLPLSGHTLSVASVAFSPDGRTIVSGSADSTVRLWDRASGQSLGQPLTGHTHTVYSVAISPDGTTLASGGSDNTVRLWDLAGHRSLGLPLTGHTGVVFSVAFSPDSRTLASASDDGTLRLWDVTSRQSLGPPLSSGTSAVATVAFSPDGRTLASAGSDNTVRLWDVARRQSLGPPLAGHTDVVHSVAFSPDGRVLASASEDGTVRLWEVASRQALGPPLAGRIGSVHSVAFSPDGTMLAAGGDNGNVRLWDVASHEALVAPLIGHTDTVNSVAFSPDGMTIASGSDDKTIRLWDINPRSWLDRSCRAASRNLSQEEWTAFMGADVPYQRTCPVLPPGGGAPPNA